MRFAVFLFPFFAYTQTPELIYTRLTPQGAVPSPRVDGAIAYDPVRRQVILFGGIDAAGFRDDTWVYSIDDRQWREINPSGPRPPSRFGHSVVYDSRRERVVLFAGEARAFFNDVWALDLRSNSWVQLSAGGGPPPRYAHGAIYDSRRDRMVISHGFTSETGRFNDTWAFDFASNSWRDLTPPDAKPLRRCLHHTVYDEANDQMLLFGGCASGFGPCPLDDLWSFDLAGNRWTERTGAPRPRARERYGMAFDSKRGRLVLFSGSGGLDDTWEWEPRSNRWTNIAPGGDRPAARSRHEAAYAPDLGAVFFFGGQLPAYTNELLMLAPAPGPSPPSIASGGVRNAFSGLNTAAAPGEIKAVYGTGLGPAVGIAAQFDASGNLPYSIGGVSATVNGIAAPLYYASATQVNPQIPYEIAGQSEAITRISYNGATSVEERLPLAASNPGIHDRIFNHDFSQNGPENPAPREGIVIFYVTGQGLTIPVSASGRIATDPYPIPAGELILEIGGQRAGIKFAGQAPGTAGVMQINAMIPSGVQGEAPVNLSIGGNRAQSGVRIWVQ